MILVVGATGDLGMAIGRRLRDKGRSVRGLVRTTSDPARVRYLENLGVKTVVGSVRDRATLDAACQGAESVITTATITRSRQADDTLQNVDQAGQISLVDAAQAADVSHFIYISFSKNLNTHSPLTMAKRTVEQYLMCSGLTFTILRPSLFMEVWLSPIAGFDYLHAKARIYGSGNNKLSWISRGDVAAFSVAALDSLTARNAILELGGPEALSPLEVVRIFERMTGRAFEVEHVSEQALSTLMAQTTDCVQHSFTSLMLDYAQGDVIDMKNLLREFPMRLLSVGNYARHVLDQY